MGSKATALFFVFLIFTLDALPPNCACGPCTQPRPRPPSYGSHPKKPHPHPPCSKQPPVVSPPIILPLLPPPVIYPPPYPPYGGGPPSGGGGGGGVPGHPLLQPTCPIDALKLGLCLDVVGGLVHVGKGDPVTNICCPVIQGLLEIEAAICLCSVIRIKLLNLNIFVPLALKVLVNCGRTPPPGFVCPAL